MSEVATAYRQLFEDLSTMADALLEISSGMDEISTGSGEIRDAVGEIRNLAQGLKEKTGELQKAL